jgi:hypothetical protein
MIGAIAVLIDQDAKSQLHYALMERVRLRWRGFRIGRWGIPALVLLSPVRFIAKGGTIGDVLAGIRSWELAAGANLGQQRLSRSTRRRIIRESAKLRI